ncbi:MAG TPA: 30S ribosomal protein S16 [Syntrophales bacterium]|nr:30S ribosomal protein S16 [Syntrophales bacterium]HOL58807.1 30S ribosomal protein S16 [Syntrophales bacterium]HPO35134.1 30S ribosomal protein S16 [Syntrophales bacterium]
MAVKIRLARMGGHKRPFYRLIVADSRSPRDGRSLEVVGHYDPQKDMSEVVIKEERIRQWLDKGAKPTPIVSQILEKKGLRVNG